MPLIPNEPIAEFLNIVLIENSWIFINLWHLVHLSVGFLLMKYFLIEKKNRFLLLFSLLVIYEQFELIVGMPLFRPEIRADIFFDIVIALIGGYIATWK